MSDEINLKSCDRNMYQLKGEYDEIHGNTYDSEKR
jgi:hypothetical protein